MRKIFLQILFLSLTQNCKNEKPEPKRYIGAGQSPQRFKNFSFFAHIAIHFPSAEGEAKVNECGGALVHPAWVLTAAHCFEKANVEYLAITNMVLVTMGAGRDGISTKVSDIKPHPKYSIQYDSNQVITRIEYDIAVCKLQKPYMLSKLIQIAHLPEHNTRSATHTRRCKTGVVLGSNKALNASQNATHNLILWSFNVDSVTPAEENFQEPRRLDTVFYTKTQFAPGHSMVAYSGCPFVCYETVHGKTIPVVYGVTSWGHTRGDYKVTVFEEVDRHIPFINKYVQMVESADGRRHHQTDFLGQRREPSANEGNALFMSFLMFAFVLLIL